MTPAELAAYGVAADRAAVWAAPLKAAMDEFLIKGPMRESMFLATLMHESAGFRVLEENLNYSAQGLANTWARFSTTGQRGGPPNGLAQALARNPQAIANEVYALRNGNGSRESGDGWLYRGSGPGQLTFRGNFRRVGKRLGLDLELNPDQVRQVPTVGALTAACHWYDAGLNDLADRGDFDKVSDVWNLGRRTERVGDSIGWPDRLAKWQTIVESMNA
jgi:putative chitinase